MHLELSAAVFPTLKLQNRIVIRSSHHVDQQGDDGSASSRAGHDEQVVGHVELVGVADVLQGRATYFSGEGVPRDDAVLPDVHTDLLHPGCPVALGGLDDFTGGPYVVEHEHRHRGETEHAQPGHSQHVGEEDKHPADAAATGGCLKLAVQLLDCAGGVEALCQQDDPVQEEEGRNAVDDVLHQLDYLAQQGMVTGVGGEVLLQDGHGARQGHMPTAAEQGHPREAEDGGHQGGVGDSSQTLDAALEAAWTRRRENAARKGQVPRDITHPAHEQRRRHSATFPCMLYG